MSLFKKFIKWRRFVFLSLNNDEDHLCQYLKDHYVGIKRGSAVCVFHVKLFLSLNLFPSHKPPLLLLF